MGSPFIVQLVQTFNQPQQLHLLMEALLGGELYATYNRQRLHGNVVCAKFYVASVAYGISHLHMQSVVCRGVKPEDCVLDADGRLKLVDMGLAKIIIGKTFTTCGTPDYFSPEIISGAGYGFGTDWWSCGVLL